MIYFLLTLEIILLSKRVWGAEQAERRELQEREGAMCTQDARAPGGEKEALKTRCEETKGNCICLANVS